MKRTAYNYSAEIFAAQDAGGFGRRPVPDSQIELGRIQLKFSAQRRGKLSAESAAVVVDEPNFSDPQSGEIEAITMAIGEDGNRFEHRYGLDLVDSFVQKMAGELVANKQLASLDDLRFRVYAVQAKSAAADGVTATVHERPLPLIPGQVQPLLDQATAVGTLEADDYPVFILQSALDQAHEIVWQRNREKGVWLVGNLFEQTEPQPEIFAVIHTVFEARGATHERFSLDFSTETWQHAAAQLDRRRNRLGRKQELVLGFMHSHPFLPSILDGKEACPTCSLRDECQLTSSFFSQRDGQFHTAVFRVAYAVELVLGLDPREEFVLKMFTLDGGTFRERGYYTLAEIPTAYTAT